MSDANKTKSDFPEPPPGLARMEGETDQSWRGFIAYVTVAARCRRATSRAIGHKHHKTVAMWSLKFQWIKRADAWDIDCLKAARDADVKARIRLRTKIYCEQLKAHTIGVDALEATSRFFQSVMDDDGVQAGVRLQAAQELRKVASEAQEMSDRSIEAATSGGSVDDEAALERLFALASERLTPEQMDRLGSLLALMEDE